MELAAVISIIGAAVAVAGAFVQWRRSTAENSVSKSEESGNLAEAAKTAAGVLIETLKFAQEERKEFERRIDELEAVTRELTERKAEREVQIRALEYDLGRLQAQVGDWEKKYIDLETKYKLSKNAIEILVKALTDANIPLPAGLELFLGDSISKYKLPKAGR